MMAELPHQQGVPNRWKRLRVVDLGEVQGGKQRDMNAPGQLRPYLRVANVFDGRINVSDVLSMPFTDEEFKRYLLAEGDVLLNEGQSLELVGRCSLYRGEFGGPCAFQNALIRFRAGPHTTPEFAEQLFRWCQKSGVFASIATQTTSIAHLGIKRFAHLLVNVPPLGEQRKIAAILASVDETIEKTEAVIAQLQVVKQAMMQELLTRGLPGRHTRFKHTELGALPETWAVIRLGDAGEWMSGGTPSKSNADYWVGDIPWVSPKDMKQPRIGDAIDHVSEHAIGSGTRLIPANTILMVVRGMILAHSFPVALTTKPVAFNQDIKALQVRRELDAEFILYYLRSQRERFLALTAESSHGTRRLPSDALLCQWVPAPPKTEQRHIAEMLRSMDETEDAHRRELTELKQLKQGLMSVLLTGEVRVTPDGDTR